MLGPPSGGPNLALSHRFGHLTDGTGKTDTLYLAFDVLRMGERPLGNSNQAFFGSNELPGCKDSISRSSKRVSTSDPPPQNDSASFAFVQRHEPLCWKFARVFAAEHSDQQDLGQEIMITVWSAFGQQQADVKESTFVDRVALNRAITWARGRDRYNEHLQSFARQSRETHRDSVDQEAERLEWLYSAIRTLSDPDRSLILMHLDRIRDALQAIKA